MGSEMVRLKKIAPLPYIKIPTNKGELKMLIDCGANMNIITKKWATSSGKQIYQIPKQPIKGVTGKNCISEVVYLTPFSPFIPENFEISIFDFHPFFDGILGTGIIFDERVNFNSSRNTLRISDGIDTLDVPIHF